MAAMEIINSLISMMSDWLFGTILVWVLLGAGIWFTFGTRAVQLRHMGSIARAVVGSRGGAEGGNGVFHAVLPQFDDVHIAFGDEQGTFARLHGLVQAVQLKALVKPGCLRRVQVFRLRFTHCPRTKGDDFAFDVVDGEDDALTEPVVMVVVFDADQSHILQQLQRVFAAKVGKQGIAGRGIAEQEGINGCFF